jgi:lipopolysaccharide/colanic/teichoic acid biosynthesis glycosyltransferase
LDIAALSGQIGGDIDVAILVGPTWRRDEEASQASAPDVMGVGAVATSRRTVSFVAKRILDLLLSSVILLLVLPVLVGISLAIKLDSPGPVLFRQERVGSRRRVRGGREIWEPRLFRVFKFRSMVYNCDNSVHESHIKAFVEGRLDGNGENGSRFKLTRDPRVTRVGQIIRRTSLDELPQLLNVLGGTMSLVGPRPVPEYEAVQYPTPERFGALPGITGLWQVRGRCDLPFHEMSRLDSEYVQRRSLGLDLKILALTVPAVLNGRGAG